MTMHLTIRIDQADTHIHISLWVNGQSRAGTLCFRPDEWFEFDRRMQKAFPNAYVLENTQLLEGLAVDSNSRGLNE